MSASIPGTSTREFFEQKYKESADPWNFAASEYELGRYRAILDALHGRRYARAFEPGCSIGVLTAELAQICGSVLAMDLSPTAVQHARERCRAMPHVDVQVGSVAEMQVEGSFDLIVLSEIGYYFSEPELYAWSSQLVRRLVRGGTLIAVHWLGASPDHRRSGDEVHQTLRSVANEVGLRLVEEKRAGRYRLDRWESD